MCILCFYARAGYLQHYEALLKELNAQVPDDDAGPQAEPQNQYDVERFALADRNHNLLSETGLLYPSLKFPGRHEQETFNDVKNLGDKLIYCVRTCTYQYVFVYTGTYKYVLSYT
jgi:hypothetical protein